MISGKTVRILPVAVAIFDSNGQMKDSSFYLSDLLEYKSPDELISKGQINLFKTLVDKETVLNQIDKTGKCETEIDLQTTGEKRLHISLTTIISSAPGSRKTKFLSVFTNQTQHKIASEELKNEQQYTNALINSLPIVLFVYNDKGRLVKWNRHKEMQAGYSDEELKSKTLYSWFADEDVPRLKKAIGEVYHTGTTSFEANVVMKDGRKVPYLFSGRKLETDDGNYLLGVGLDISERKEAEEALKRNDQKYYDLINHGNDGITIHHKGSIIFANEVAQNYLGYRPDEIVGEFITKFIVPEDHERMLNQAQDRARGLPVPPLSETTLLRKDGSKWPVELHTKLIEFEGNKVHLSFVRDITQRKILELKLKQATEEAIRANTAKTQFLANMSHEIRTPINTVIGLSDVLWKKINDPELKDYIDSIRSSSQTLLGLINEILDLSKIEAGKMELKPYPTNLRKAFKTVISIFSYKASDKGLNLDIKVTKAVPESILIDELRFKQIVINLLGNAIKFTDNGSVKVNLDAFKSTEGLTQIILTVEDSGIGIPESEQKRIFEPFVQQDDQDTKKYQGTGLGLSITSRIIQLMEGQIQLVSNPGQGSRFIVQLPNIKILKDRTPITHDSLSDPQTDPSIPAEKTKDTLNRESTQEDLLSESQLREISEVFHSEINPLWESFGSKIPIKDVKHFAQKLTTLGKDYKCHSITEYGRYIQGTLLSYNIEEMEKTLQEFPILKQKLSIQ